MQITENAFLEIVADLEDDFMNMVNDPKNMYRSEEYMKQQEAIHEFNIARLAKEFGIKWKND